MRRGPFRLNRGILLAAALGTLVLSAACQEPAVQRRAPTGVEPLPGLTPAPAVAGDPERGRALFTDRSVMAPSGCGTCHTVRGVPGATGVTGPNLTNVALRPTIAGDSIPNSPENMAGWIRNAPAMKPGIVMPPFPEMTGQQARDLTAFLYSQPYNTPAR